MRLRLVLTLLAVAALGAGPVSAVRVDDWEAGAAGPLDLNAIWRRYPPGKSAPFKHPPAIVHDDGRPVLQLRTEGEAMRVGRQVKVDVKKTPWLTWEWKPLVLPDGGDVRDYRRNDQAGRIMLVFEGMRALLYVWDTTAPVGATSGPDGLDMFQRALIVVRSGPPGLGRWHREQRDVAEDYRRVFEDDPRPIKWVGLESHSNDTNTRTWVMFGRVQFEAR